MERREKMNKYEEIKKLINSAGESVEFAEFGNGVSDEWIVNAEERLGFKLPNSYKWWLSNYSGGEICAAEIFSIYGQDFDTVIGGDIVYMYELNRKNNNFSDEKVIICEADDDVFYFDLTMGSQENELPVFSLKNNEKYADDFIEFLKRRITESI
ncbi:SMI1/KNR4 family protein [Mesobacillus subterraneus]|uniref:SMI1/KNR4 family protein n=1 Tax=Mesobacillus subterraneus TaxID=285983 RepID=UPI00203F28A7|nr:SMI1/KNR4 family protein [Mesobacillus subterraneus]MCM3685336.1 SMI1/KNR4 family protein [Mesobacillus subterraneus]